MSEDRTPTVLAKAISVILHPVLMPIYLMLVLMSQGFLLHTMQAKVYFALVIVLNTVAVPAVCTFLFTRVRFWRENPNTDFRRRILPMVVMIICYGACMMMIRNIPFAYPVKKMLMAGVACLAFGLVVTFFWRISLHMTAQGAAAAFLGVMLVSGAENLLPVFCAVIALAAMLASARLYLGAHDWKQVGAGFIGGAGVTLLTVYLI